MPAVVDLFGLERVNYAIANVGYGAKECCVCRDEIAEMDPAYMLVFRYHYVLMKGAYGEVFHHERCADGARLTLRMIGAEEAAEAEPLVSVRCGAGDRHCNREIGRVSYFDGSYWWVGVEPSSTKFDDRPGALVGRRQRRHRLEKLVRHDERPGVCYGYLGVAIELTSGVESITGWCEGHQKLRRLAAQTELIPAATTTPNPRGRIRTIAAQR